MLVSAFLVLAGGAWSAFAHRRWDLPVWTVPLVPALALGVLWDPGLAPVVLSGSLLVYGGWRALPGSVALRERPGTALVVAATGAGVPAGLVTLSGGVPWPVGLIGALAATLIGSELAGCERERAWFEAGIGLFGVTGLTLGGLFLLWLWTTPPSLSALVFGVRFGDLGARPLVLAAGADGVALTDALAFLHGITPFATLSLVATLVGTLVFLYVLASVVGHVRYTAQRGTERVEDLTFVLVTVATEDVRESLVSAIEHTQELFPEYDLTVLIDEGAPLRSELESMGGDLVVVPDEYDPEAVAKGRAMQYFVQTRVDEDEWYAFLDDDNLVQGREFLFEIPRQAAEGNLVMNPVLLPRRGGSVIPFAIDHMRTLFDLTFFRTFTGLLGRPYAGLHGELLCARGDVLGAVGFDRETIVEDFAFADELVRRGIGTWQSRTTTSILSPRSLDDYFTQRTRWFLGKARWLPRCSPGTLAVTGVIQAVWLLGIFGGWLAGGLWLVAGPPAQVVYLGPAIVSSGLYGTVYLVGVARAGGRHLPKALLLPVYATIEHLAPYYAMLRGTDSFEVVEK